MLLNLSAVYRQKKFERIMQIFSLLSDELSTKLERIINHKS